MLPRFPSVYPVSLALFFIALVAGCVPDEGRPDFEAMAYLKVVKAEDARPAGGPDLDLLVAATRSPSERVRAAGVRGLGRLERLDVLEAIVALLDDPDPSVRAEAANAVAQAAHRGPGDEALRHLTPRLEVEEHRGVVGVLARSMGRLNLEPDQRAQVVRTLMDLSYDAEGNDSPRAQLVGVTLGLESLTRIGRGQPLDAAVTDRLRELLRHGLAEQPQTSTMVQIRTLAATALGNAGQINVFDIETGLRDVGEGPRRAVAAHLDRIQAGARQEFIRRALGDPSAQVRLEAVRALARGPRDALSCEWILAVVGARELLHSRLEAIDALDRPCSNVAVQTSALTDLARSLSDTDTRDWHAPAHALKALAGLAPTRAAPFLSPFAGHSNDFVRLYAVQAAGRIGTTATVLPFLDDSSANVRTAAARELFALEGRRADPLLLELLAGAEDPQLVLTLAGLLRDSPLRSEVGEAALATLERISEPRWQTLRDPRVALIDLVETMGDSGWASGVEPYLRDYDPVVAQRAAEILIGWTGQRYLAAPRGSPRIPYPTLDDLRLMETATVRLHLERGGVIDIGLRPDLAATNAFRFLSLARQGSLDGLTFHRVAPNFVVQGGSPGANEFAGHGAYTRDEVGLSVQWQGTVGLSTRGRDTGDGQLYINLIDNVRLDHDYTIFGNVTNGMAAVHGIMEGDVIERAEVHVARQLPAR